VDFATRADALERVDRILSLACACRDTEIASLLTNWCDGTIKMLLTTAGLRLRAARPALFLDGDYLPLETDTATVPGRVLAFARIKDGAAAIAIAPHLIGRFVDADHPAPLGDMWRTSRVMLPKTLAALTYRDAITGADIRPVMAQDAAWLFVGQALKTLPVALLVAMTTPQDHDSATPD
jgi:(1->4)-alpha-D-glucan 1-alpha-D-glucosylmutase